MTGKIILTFLLAFLSQQLYAQEFIADSVSDQCFPGMFTAQEGNVLYTYYLTGTNDEKKKMATLHILSFSSNMNKQPSVTTEVSKTTVVLGAAYAEIGYIFLLADPVAKTRTMLKIGPEGKIIFKKSEDNIPAQLLTGDKPYYIFNAMPEGCIIVTPAADKNNGYTIAKYDRELAEQWKKDFKGKNSVELITCQSMMDRLIVLEKNQLKKDQYSYSLKAIQTDGGTEVYNNVLQDENDFYVPQFLNFKHGMGAVGGVYYKDGKYDEKKPGGILFGYLSPEGSFFRKAKIPFSALSKFLPEAKVNALQSGGSQLVVEDLFRTMGSELSIACEIVSKTNNTSNNDAAISITDPFVLYTNMDGEISGVSFIPGIKPVQLTVKGTMATTNMMDMSNWLSKNRAFNYQFAGDKAGKPYLFYTYMGENSRKSVMIAADSPTSANIVELPGTALHPTQKNEKDASTIINSDIKDCKLAAWQYQGMLMANNGMLYRYSLNAPKLLISGTNFMR